MSAETLLPRIPSFYKGWGASRTGYTPMREVTKELMGEDVINQTEDLFPGMDEEGELKGSYRPCGHPGVRRPIFSTTNALTATRPTYSSGSRRPTSLCLEPCRSLW